MLADPATTQNHRPPAVGIGSGRPGHRHPIARLGRHLARHWLFALILTAGAMLRIVAELAYRPVITLFGDSHYYLLDAQQLAPPLTRPFGYSGVLRVLAWDGDLALVPVVQHLVGLSLGTAVYVALIRRGAPTWLGAAAAAPVLLDGFQLHMEHLLLSETIFEAALVLALLLLLRPAPSARACALAGLLLAAAALTRTVAVPLAALALAYLLVRRVSWRAVVAMAVTAAVPLLLYGAWFHATYGEYGLQFGSGRFLYGRVAPFADCGGLRLTGSERRLCESTPPSQRPGPNFYDWSAAAPVTGLDLPWQEQDRVAAGFARKVIANQPAAYARTVAADTLHYFAPGRSSGRRDAPVGYLRFITQPIDLAASAAVAPYDWEGNARAPHLDHGLARWLRAYQGLGQTPGPVLGAAVLLAVAGAAIGRPRPEVSRWDPLLFGSVGLALLAIPSATAVFDYRYVLPAIPVLSLAGGLGLLMLLHRFRPDDRPTGEPGGDRAALRRGLGVLVGAAIAILPVAAWTSPLHKAPVFVRYALLRAEQGPLGPPVSAVRKLGATGVLEQDFRHGSIYLDPRRSYTLYGEVAQVYREAGGLVRLGLPVGRTHTRHGRTVLVCQHATLTVDRATGDATVTPR